MMSRSWSDRVFRDAIPLPVNTFPIGTSLTKGLTFSSFKTPNFGRRIQRSVSGRELVVQDYANPIWQFKLQFSFLRDFPSVDEAGHPLESEFRNLLNFYTTIQAIGDTFYYLDRDDWLAEDEPLAPGDGSTTGFQLRRRIFPGGYGEYVTAPWTVDEVKIDGTPTTDYSTDFGRGIINFGTPPADGAIPTVTYSYFFRCRFIDDAVEFERFAHQFWSLREIRFRSVLF